MVMLTYPPQSVCMNSQNTMQRTFLRLWKCIPRVSTLVKICCCLVAHFNDQLRSLTYVFSPSCLCYQLNDSKADEYLRTSYCINNPADLTVSKRPGTSFRIEIHFAVFNRLYLLFSFIKLNC